MVELIKGRYELLETLGSGGEGRVEARTASGR